MRNLSKIFKQKCLFYALMQNNSYSDDYCDTRTHQFRRKSSNKKSRAWVLRGVGYKGDLTNLVCKTYDLFSLLFKSPK